MKVSIKYHYYENESHCNEIAAGTVKNYYQAVKLFWDMNDIPVAWKKIRKGLPRVRKFGEDRSPTIEEIRKIIEYPDRRIKGDNMYDGIIKLAVHLCFHCNTSSISTSSGLPYSRLQSSASRKIVDARRADELCLSMIKLAKITIRQ